jgi:hypothetical protein
MVKGIGCEKYWDTIVIGYAIFGPMSMKKHSKIQ